MGGKAPSVIVTHQSSAMRVAIQHVPPNTIHRYCIWHIMSKLDEKIGHKEDAGKDIRSVVWGSTTEEQFESRWKSTITQYSLQDNGWLTEMFEMRVKWVPAYLSKFFWTGMSSTQRSKSKNAFLDMFVNSKTCLSASVKSFDSGLTFFTRFFSRLFVLSGSDDNPRTTIRGRIKGIKKNHYQWEKKLARHLCGQYSMAVAQANLYNEDRCQLVSGSLSTIAHNGPTGVFVGIYDGHGGDICSQFVLDHLFNNLKAAITNQQGYVDAMAIQQAYIRTENRFFSHVRSNWRLKPRLAAVGSCCLSGIVHNHVLYVANAGNSRAVIGKWGVGDENAEAVQLSIDYNANDQDRRNELLLEHHDDPDLFRVVNGSYCVRGRIQVTRSFGHLYLKSNEFNREPLEQEYRQERPIDRPILKAVPTVHTYQLEADDKFVIFASDGLWGNVTNEEAVSIVKGSPRSGAAKALLAEALNRASQRNNLEYHQLLNLPLIVKKTYHDDISIVILYFDN
ncbi:Protein phosphatase 2C [Rhynchospora pubera]|uniref:Protein FAR1-RELATED SEQUENCE n=1 Tax=Rhynchospora pubera TaxID=906938 RepID=A0AAV8DU95_9POAL|nr:Protein phosphatase 2C [Rhynchospora pubera]KAJ4786163.1 Protein phosphatase 2C [Rhynchospora pubera]